MKLKDIIRNCGVLDFSGSTDIDITALCNDSRKVVPGSLFVAVSGCGNDGRAYIGKAIEAGAAAVMCEGECPAFEGTAVRVGDSRLAVAMAADTFYGHPSGRLRLVGITGTNGKTTTATLLYNMMRAMGHDSGLLSTIANYVGSRRLETANTTSDPVTINSLLAQMVESGCRYCFMEVSSIGVDQMKTAGLEFAVGIFTNLTHDHLDYHGTFDAYLRCKQRFFDALGPKAWAITNIDDRNGLIMTQNSKAHVVTCSCRKAADHNCKVVEKGFEGMQLSIDGREVWTMLTGRHNAANVLAVYCCGLALGFSADELLPAISLLRPAEGRLETIHGPRDLNVVIDYAHTPDALENVLETLRDIAPDRQLVCLFGCGGDRDKSKRPEMGQIAAKLADRVILTSDNSRSESTEQIISEIRGGMDSAGLAKTVSIADRKEAIRAALSFAPRGATVLLAGKGHEKYQIIGKEKSHFDEREITEEIFRTLQ